MKRANGNQFRIGAGFAIALALLAGTVLKSQAQMGAMPGGEASGPIDITADEQEFAENAVIARGRVKVKYKDSIVLAPLATLYKDAEGNPNRAVFTGNPRLTQGSNKINASVLTFEMKQNKIIADGNAHSEVDVPEDENQEDTSILPVATKTSQPAANSDSDDEDDEEKAAAPPVVQKPQAKKPAAKKGSEKIITDSDRQEYDQASGQFEAIGHVKVHHGDITVLADKLQLVYSAASSNKPETALFSGHVTATQGRNMTSADNMSYSLSSKRLQATGHVKSKVIQEKSDDSKETKPGPSAKADFLMPQAKASNNRQAQAQGANSDLFSGSSEKPVWVFSDSQDYSKEVGRVSATGNVRVVSGDMYGSGPAVVLMKRPDGRAEKIKFIGRSQISQPGRRWIADEIIYIVDEQRVIANGHAKAMIIQNQGQGGPGPQLMPDFAPKQQDNTRLAQSAMQTKKKDEKEKKKSGTKM